MSRYLVTAPGVVAKVNRPVRFAEHVGSANTLVQLFRGDVLPPDADPAHVAHLLALGLVEPIPPPHNEE